MVPPVAITSTLGSLEALSASVIGGMAVLRTGAVVPVVVVVAGGVVVTAGLVVAVAAAVTELLVTAAASANTLPAGAAKRDSAVSADA